MNATLEPLPEPATVEPEAAPLVGFVGPASRSSPSPGRAAVAGAVGFTGAAAAIDALMEDVTRRQTDAVAAISAEIAAAIDADPAAADALAARDRLAKLLGELEAESARLAREHAARTAAADAALRRAADPTDHERAAAEADATRHKVDRRIAVVKPALAEAEKTLRAARRSARRAAGAAIRERLKGREAEIGKPSGCCTSNTSPPSVKCVPASSS